MNYGKTPPLRVSDRCMRTKFSPVEPSQNKELVLANCISASLFEKLYGKVSMRVQLKLYGVFRSAANASTLSLDIPDKKPTVRLAIQRLVSRKEFAELQSLLIDSANSDPRPKALILISGREINALKGLETELKEDDELALLPIAHGG